MMPTILNSTNMVRKTWFSDVKEVKETNSYDEVMEKINSGWRVMDTYTKIDKETNKLILIFALGRVELTSGN